MKVVRSILALILLSVVFSLLYLYLATFPTMLQTGLRRSAAHPIGQRSPDLTDILEKELLRRVDMESPQTQNQLTFNLQGIFWGASRPQAIINRRILSEGDEINGARVISIRKEGIVLFILSNEKEISLKPACGGKDAF